jgi:hypothetical protein
MPLRAWQAGWAPQNQMFTQKPIRLTGEEHNLFELGTQTDHHRIVYCFNCAEEVVHAGQRKNFALIARNFYI